MIEIQNEEAKDISNFIPQQETYFTTIPYKSDMRNILCLTETSHTSYPPEQIHTPQTTA